MGSSRTWSQRTHIYSWWRCHAEWSGHRCQWVVSKPTFQFSTIMKIYCEYKTRAPTSYCICDRYTTFRYYAFVQSGVVGHVAWHGHCGPVAIWSAECGCSKWQQSAAAVPGTALDGTNCQAIPGLPASMDTGVHHSWNWTTLQSVHCICRWQHGFGSGTLPESQTSRHIGVHWANRAGEWPRTTADEVRWI